MSKSKKKKSSSPQIDTTQMQRILDSTGDGYLLHDIAGNIFDVNLTLCDQLGYDKTSLMQLNVSDIEISSAKTSRALWQVLVTDKSLLTVVGIFRRKNGSTYPVETKLSVVEIDGTPYIAVFARDTTQRLLNKRQMRFTEFAIDSAADAAFWFKASDPTFIYVNNKACQYLGYTRDELLQMSVHDINPKFPKDGWPTFIQRALNAPELVFESDHLTKSGALVPVEVVAKHMQFEGESFIITFVRDITQRRIYDLQLREAKDAAEHANKAKSDFLSSMSHELKTPLNAILGYSELLEESDNPHLSEEQLLFAGKINFAGRHLLELIDEVLDLAAIESGRINLKPASVKIDTLVTECIDLVAPLTAQKNITLVNNASDNRKTAVFADIMKLKQVIINLLSNAIKYNKVDGTVTISYTILDDKLKLAVTDTGMGIPANRKSELFVAFSRLGRENTDIKGSGIGLLVCSQLVNRMNGAMGVDSEENQGSTFWFTIPLAQ